jgi:crotonobetainyl-CoA:carnitine CoA-transferase CaiB-like acyl-CoA transferase
MNGPALLDWTVNKRPMRRNGQPNSNRSQFVPMVPHGIYPCRGDDHWIAIACRDDDEWQRLAAEIDEPWTKTYGTLDARTQHQDELDTKLSAWTNHHHKFDLQMALRQRSIPVAAVQKPQERIDHDPTTSNFGLWPTVKHTKMGDVRVDGLPVHMSRTDWQIRRGAPCLGEHTEQVLTGLLGMTSEDVAVLREENVI